MTAAVLVAPRPLLLGSALLETVLVYLLLVGGAVLLGALFVLRGVRRRMRYRADPTATPDEYVNCSSCGARTPATDEACRTCGTAIEATPDNADPADSGVDAEQDAADEEWVEWGSVESATETERSE